MDQVTRPFPRFSLMLITLAFALALLFTNVTPLALISIGLVLFIAVIPVLWSSYRGITSIPRSPIAIILLLFWLWLLVSMLLSPTKYVSLLGFFLVGSMPLLFWLLTLSGGIEEFWRRWQPIIFAAGFVVALFGISQIFLTQETPKAFFVQKNTFGAFINLVTLPMMAYSLTLSRGWLKNVILVGVFVMLCAMCSVNGYGVAIGFVVGFGLMLVLLRKSCSKRDLEILVLLALLAYLLDRIFVAKGLMPTDLTQHSAPRLIIWAATWKLWHTTPWYGSGIYNFFLAYRPFMPPFDLSAGQYVHNDYFQFLVELGYVGFVLALGLIAALFYGLIRWLKSARAVGVERIETIGIFAGMLAIGVHSLFTYNFYISAILFVFGTMLARFNATVFAETKFWWHLPIAKYVTNKGYKAIMLVVMLTVVGWITMVFSSEVLYLSAVNYGNQGKYAQVIDRLKIAESIYPTYQLYNFYAVVYTNMLHRPKLTPQEREILFKAAKKAILKAQQLNPWRPIPYLLAKLYVAAPDVVGSDWYELTTAALATQLHHYPRLYNARMLYVRLLKSHHQYKKAAKVLANGLPYFVHNWWIRTDFEKWIKQLEK